MSNDGARISGPNLPLAETGENVEVAVTEMVAGVQRGFRRMPLAQFAGLLRGVDEPPANIELPAITGTLTPSVYGPRLFLSNGSWGGSPSIRKQWMRDGVAIPGAVFDWYDPFPGDANKVLTGLVTATSFSGVTQVISAATAAVIEWTPTALFAGGELGGFYRPRTASSVWQGVDGTTAGAVDAVVGRIDNIAGGANAKHIGHGTAGSKPLLKADGTRRYLQSDGVDDALKSVDAAGADVNALIPAAPPFTIIITGWAPSGTSRSTMIAQHEGVDLDNMHYTVNSSYIGDGSTEALSAGRMLVYFKGAEDGGSTTLNGQSKSLQVGVRRPFVHSLVAGAGVGEARLYLMHVEKDSFTVVEPISQAALFRVFSHPSLIENLLAIRTYGLLVIDRALTAAELQQTVDFFAEECGIAEDRHAIEPPVVAALQACSMDVKTGRVLYSLNPDITNEPGSCLKTLTAATVDKWVLDWATTLTVSADAAAVIGTSADIEEGDVLTVQDTVMGMLLRSGNDAARAVAEHVGGLIRLSTALPLGTNEERRLAFVAEMNVEAVRLGMTNTSATSASGVDDTGQWISARDLATITRDVFLNRPRVRAAMGTLSYEMTILAGPTPRVYTINNGFVMIGEEDVVGGKGGNTVGAGASLTVVIRTSDGNEVVHVLLEDSSDEQKAIDARLMADAVPVDWVWFDNWPFLRESL